MDRIDLGQARKRAKELVRRGEAPKLADAQRLVARELGFASWPRLVHRAEALAVADEERHAAFVDRATNGRADRAEALLAADPALLARDDVALLVGEPRDVDPARPLGRRGWLPLVHVTHSAFLGGPRTGALVATGERLLDAGADPNASWQHPELGALSALYGAAGVAHEPRMTRLLLERGANPDDGESLYHACETRDHACLRLLLGAGATVDGTNALAHMLDYDDLEGLRLLLDAGGTPHRGLVRHALGRDRSRAHVELLLAHGAEPTEEDATLAVRRGRTDLADLLGRGAPSPSDALLGALRRGDRAGADDVLRRHPGLLDRLGRRDHDVLVHAAGTGNRAALALMLDLGFPVDVRSEEFEETPLHAAAWYGQARVAELLLDRGADPNAEAGDPFGGRPLDWVARGSRYAEPGVLGDVGSADHRRVAEALLARGARLAQPERSRDAATDEVAALLDDG